MSEADTPKPSPSSGNEYDSIDELITFEDDTDESDSLDEVIAALEHSTSTAETNDRDSCLGDRRFREEPIPATANTALSHQQLQEQNHQLLLRTAELKSALANAQAELEEQQLRLREAEDLNAQQNDEINAASEQNLSLSQELKNYRLQEEQHVEKITQLTHQLQISQQRVAQLERECALIQKQFQEQSYKLCQAEKYSRELSFRLQQQRRHTWQFKSALNKCLETTAEKEDYELIPNPTVSSQPIPAWSSQHNSDDGSQDKSVDLAISFEENADAQPESANFSAAEENIASGEATSDALTGNISEPEVKPSLTAVAQKTRSRYSPAPLLVSSRKKRQSYSAVELPKFIR